MATGNVKSQWTALGWWEKITSYQFQTLDTVVHHGFQTAKTNDERLAQSISLQYQFANGITWETSSNKVQPLVNTLAGVIEISQDTYQADYSVDVSATCPYSDDLVILSQWVVSSADGSDKLYTPNLVCEGEQFDISDHCPPTGCLNDDCTECSDPAL